MSLHRNKPQSGNFVIDGHLTFFPIPLTRGIRSKGTTRELLLQLKKGFSQRCLFKGSSWQHAEHCLSID